MQPRNSSTHLQQKRLTLCEHQFAAPSHTLPARRAERPCKAIQKNNTVHRKTGAYHAQDRNGCAAAHPRRWCQRRDVHCHARLSAGGSHDEYTPDPLKRRCLRIEYLYCPGHAAVTAAMQAGYQGGRPAGRPFCVSDNCTGCAMCATLAASQAAWHLLVP